MQDLFECSEQGSGPVDQSAPVVTVSAAKLSKALAESEQLVLTMSQTLRNLSSSDTFSAVNLKFLQGLLTKSSAKLAPSSTNFITADYDPSSGKACRGIAGSPTTMFSSRFRFRRHGKPCQCKKALLNLSGFLFVLVKVPGLEGEGPLPSLLIL